MNQRIFLIISLLFAFTISSPSFSANKTSTERYNSLLKQAKSGDAKAMFLLARMIERGKGTQKDINQASKWYQRSASQNYAAANARLGKLYLEGITVNKNPEKAFSLLNLAAIQGIPVAQFNVAILYELGIGTEKDLQEAIKWYDIAAKGGYYSAKLKSRYLKQQLGLSIASVISNEQSTPVRSNAKPEKIIPAIPVKKQLPVAAKLKPKTQTKKTIIVKQQPAPVIKKRKPTPATSKESNLSKNDDSEELALLSNGFEREAQLFEKNTTIDAGANSPANLEPAKQQQIKQALLTLLTGRWFDKNRPAIFLPSPKAQCNIINKVELKCTSRQLQRRTENETIYFKTFGKISKLNNHGNFVIQYQNTIVRVVVDKKTTAKGTKFISKIKTGLQKKIHQLNCQYKDKSNLVCIKDNSEKYSFQNRAVIDE